MEAVETIMSGKIQKGDVLVIRYEGPKGGPCIGYVAPEAADCGPITLVKEGDVIHINLCEKSLTIDVDDEEFAKRRENWQPTELKAHGYYLEHYRKQVGSVWDGAMLQ